MSELREKSVLVTGASGFIGGQLAEQLSRKEGARVLGTGRRFSNEKALREAGVEIIRADLRDAATLSKLCTDKHVVFHMAAWGGRQGGVKEAYAVNVDATRALAEAAAAAGVKRFVLASTVAAYGLPTVDEIDESVPIDVNQGDLYGRTKALGEQAALEVARRTGLPLTIVRPGMVYGPGSAVWTIGMLRMVQKGAPVLLGDGSGYAFPVYIDDVLDLLRRAATRPEAVGQAFNVCGPSIPWEQFFGYYARMSGRRLRRLPMFLAQLLARTNEFLALGLPLTPERVQYVSRRLQFSSARAERQLDFRFGVPLDEGMQRSEAWLRKEGYLR